MAHLTGCLGAAWSQHLQAGGQLSALALLQQSHPSDKPPLATLLHMLQWPACSPAAVCCRNRALVLSALHCTKL